MSRIMVLGPSIETHQVAPEVGSTSTTNTIQLIVGCLLDVRGLTVPLAGRLSVFVIRTRSNDKSQQIFDSIQRTAVFLLGPFETTTFSLSHGANWPRQKGSFAICLLNERNGKSLTRGRMLSTISESGR